MPDTVEQIIARSRETRERIQASRATRGGRSPASLEGRAHAAVRRIEGLAGDRERETRMASVRSARPAFLAGSQGADDSIRFERRTAFQAFIRYGDQRMRPEQIKALRTADDKSGGFLVPMDMERQLVRNLVQVSQVRQVARVGTTSTDTVRVPKRTGASTASWVTEVETASSTAPVYGAVDISIADARCYIDLSNNLLDDAAINIEEELAMELAREFGRLEGASFINGTGVKQPMGLMVSSDVGYYPGGDGSNNLVADAIISLPFQLADMYGRNGVWLMNRSTMAAVRKLKDTQNRYLFDANLDKDGLPTIQGRPVYDCPDMDSIGANTFPILFGDVASAYRIYDRLQVSILRDPFTLATTGQTRFHARRRLGAAVVLGEAVNGGKRYLKVLADFSGTHATGTPIGVVVVKGNPDIMPAN